MKNNILNKYITKINHIYLNIYILIMFIISLNERIIYFPKIINIIIITILLITLTLFTLLYLKFNKNLKDTYQIDKNYYDFFIKYHTKGYPRYLFPTIISIISLIISINNKTLGLFFISEYLIISIILLLIRKTIIRNKYKKINLELIPNEQNKKETTKASIIYILKYLIITIILTIIFCKFTNAWYAWFIIPILSITTFIINSLANIPFNQFFILKRKTLGIKIYHILVILIIFTITYVGMIVGVYFLNPYIYNTKPQETKEYKIVFEDNMYKIYKDNDDFKILQLSDIHIGGSFITYHKDLKALEAIDTLVSYTKPDLIIITGDLIYPTPVQSFYLNNQTALFQLVSFMHFLNVPWTFVYGNHETEKYAFRNYKELYNLVLYGNSNLSNNKNKLLFYNYDDTITGRSNMVFEIINPNKSINQVLFLMDSNDYYSNKLNDYDYIHDDQVNWYKKTIEKIGTKNSSMLFFHIPLQETKEAVELYQRQDQSVKYYFGENNEPVSCSKYHSKLFDEATNIGSTKAIFYGHDHTNNISLEYKGIRLTYGMSIDYLATPGIENKDNQRGATLITLKDKSKFDIKQIKLKDIKKSEE